MANPYEPNIEEYRKAFANQSPAFRDDVTERLASVVDAYLMNFGECRRYNDHRHFASTIVDAILMYAIVEGYLTLSDKATATEDERTQMLNEFSRNHRIIRPDTENPDRINLRDRR